MAPRTSRSGFHGVRERPNGTFHVEIRSGTERIPLGTYETAHEAARAYDAVAWRLGRLMSAMNFQDARTLQQAQDLAPPLQVVTPDLRARERERERRLFAAEGQERERQEWARRFPEDVAVERDFYAKKKADREARRAKKRAAAEALERRKEEKLARRNAGVPPEAHITKLPESDSDWSPDEGWDWASPPVSDTTSDYDWDEE